MTRIKICGLSTPETVDAVVAAGADAIGFNFVATSPRFVVVDQAAALAARVAPFVTCVGLFVDASAEQVRAVLARVQLQSLQFQGAESDDFCASFGLPYVKAVRVSAPVDGPALAALFPRASGIQLDAASATGSGGTGTRFDWAWFPRDGAKHWILAGGLDPANVGAAVAGLRPYAVDVSSGVESAPGKKDLGRIDAFCAAVRAADQLTAARAQVGEDVPTQAVTAAPHPEPRASSSPDHPTAPSNRKPMDNRA